MAANAANAATIAAGAWGWNYVPAAAHIFIPTHPPRYPLGNTAWIELGVAGNGRNGSVKLFALTDRATGLVVDRVALKSIREEHKPQFWLNPRNWIDPAIHSEPIELAILRTLNQQPNNPFIINLLSYRVYSLPTGPLRRVIRLLMPAAEFGDLLDFAQQFHDIHGENGEETGVSMPEDFLIDMFLASAQAAEYMAQRNILNLDLKVNNIVLFADPNNDLGPFGPRGYIPTTGNGWGVKPCIIDFDVARPEISNVFNNPTDFLTRGTRGYRSPEISSRPQGLTSVIPNTTASFQTMLYGLGATFLHALHPYSYLQLAQPMPSPQVNNGTDLYDWALYHRACQRTATPLGQAAFPAFWPNRDDMAYIQGSINAMRPRRCFPTRTNTYRRLEQCISACLALNPADRPASFAALQAIAQRRPTRRSFTLERQKFPALRFNWVHRNMLGRLPNRRSLRCHGMQRRYER